MANAITFPQASEKFSLSYYNTPMVSICLVIFFRTEPGHASALARKMTAGGVVGAEMTCRVRPTHQKIHSPKLMSLASSMAVPPQSGG